MAYELSVCIIFDKNYKIGTMSIKNVILDLGGVLLDIAPEETVEGFRRLLLDGNVYSPNWEQYKIIEDNMETGKWSIDDFFEFMLQHVKPGTDPKQIEDAWCAMLGWFPVDRVRMMRALKSNYNLYLLSNTNKLHIRMFRQEFRHRFGHSMEDLFIKCYYSSDLGLRKPDVNIYKHVLQDSKLLAEETIFIDDHKENCDAAEKIGINTIFVEEGKGLEDVYHLIQ